jgi:type III secretion protein Q
VSLHNALPRWDPTVAALGRRLYGRAMRLLPETKAMLRWQAVRASHANFQIRIESSGEIFELQWIDDLPGGWPDEILHKAVPPAVRRAVFQALVEPVWSRLTQLFGLDGHLVDVQVDQPAWGPHEALGWAIVPAGSSDGPNLHGMLRAHTPAGWARLAARAPSGLPLAWVRDAQRVGLTLHCPPIALSRAELHGLAVGDVMLLDAGLGKISRLAARLKLAGQWIPSVRCLFLGHAAMITQTRARKEPVRAESSSRKTPAMSTSNPTDSAADALPLWVDLELARLPLSIEQLRGLSIGQVFELDASPDSAWVVLKCGEQRLGLGQLVAVGQRLGVRVVELATPATPVAPQAEGASA